jgi:hypothetical protein
VNSEGVDGIGLNLLKHCMADVVPIVRVLNRSTII